MNVIVEKHLAGLSSRPRSFWMTFARAARRELRAVPEAMRWLLGLDR
jgi:hypothetical protein